MLDFLKSTDYKRLEEIEHRLVRIESRVVQIMNHLGVKPVGVKSIKEKQDAKATR